MMDKLYPLKFKPIIKEKVWGGEKLKTLLHKEIPSSKTGESWEISAIEDSPSVIENGPLKGQNILDVLEQYQDKLVGKRLYNKHKGAFPLLFKFIDASENLSLQLHPNDQLAKKRHNSFGKSEMWYVMQADKNSGIYLGFKEGIKKEDYLKALEEGRLQEIMHFEEAQKGDVFYIKSGLVHAIGEGVFLAEIQQSSDITYRVFDWNRKDLDGKPRQLHTELALDAIDFDFKEYRIDYTLSQNEFQKLVKNKFFTTRLIHLTTTRKVDYQNVDSFVVYMCVAGSAEIISEEYELKLKEGETVLVPACISQITIKSSEAHLLEVTV